jgi:hypothetical protein
MPGTKRTVSINREKFIPVVRAEVGAEVPIPAYLYRIYIPVSHLIPESPTTTRKDMIATAEDIQTLRDLLIRDFGVVTLDNRPFPLEGVGARDPSRPAATQERNEHFAFEVLAAATHQSDVYFSALHHELHEALRGRSHPHPAC